jgi:hypothetical protein
METRERFLELKNAENRGERRNQIFWCKNIDINYAKKMFENAIDLELCDQIICPNLTKYTRKENGEVIKEQII